MNPFWQRLNSRFHTSTIRGKLILFSTGTLVLAGILIYVLLAYQQQRLLRDEWVESLSAQARLVATDAQAAVAFQDRREGERLLEAVSGNVYILQARLLGRDGHLFASYQRSPGPVAPILAHQDGKAGHRFTESTLHVWAPVMGDNLHEATVELVSSLEPLRREFRRAALETGMVLLMVLAISLWGSTLVVRRLSAPVEELNRVMQEIAEDTASPARASVEGHDEIAGLGRGLNALIDRLQARDRELEAYRGNLEHLVALRTRELSLATDEARRANQAKSDFLARMSHEIRTPMNAIVGLGRLMLGTRLDSRQRDYQEKVLLSADVLLEVINDVLDYSRIEAGKLTLEQIPFDLNQVVRKVAGVVALKAQEKGIELLFQIDRDVPRWALGDPSRLAQVLVNLANNAIKFTQAGEVIIRVSVKDRTDERAVFWFSVRDTGIGIAASRLGELFTPFTQGDETITRRFGGTGLGLSICKQLVGLMGGFIAVESQPGQGSHFYFTTVFGLAGQRPAEPPSPMHLQGKRVLVVDDNASARDVLKQMVAYFDMEVEVCASGEAALLHLKSAQSAGRPYHLVLLDWLMPGLDGLETAQRIHAMTAEAGQVPAILMVTAGGYEAIADKMTGAGLSHVLTKPVSESSLHDAMLEVLVGGGLTRVYRQQRISALATRRDFSGIRGARVLLVDDVSLNREVAREFLRQAGLRVDIAVNGREAVDKVNQEHYALVLMDIQMPELDGLSATREIRANPRHAGLPILAMTAHAMTGDRDISLAAGMNDHLNKPLDPDALFDALLRWIPRQDVQDRPPGPEADPEPPEESLPIPVLPGIDTDRGLINHMRRRSLYLRMLGQFGTEFGRAGEDMQQALARGDHEKARRLAHSLKSAAATLGAESLAGLARNLEYRFAAGKGEPVDVAPLASALKAIIQTLEPLARTPEPKPVAQDRAALHERMARLEAALKRDDAAAMALAEELSGVLAGPDWQEDVQLLRDLVDDVEYEAALQVLTRMMRLIESPKP